MASLLTNSEINKAKSDIQDWFDTFREFYSLVVYKEPRQTVSARNSRASTAYSRSASSPSNFENTTKRSKTFKVVKVSGSGNQGQQTIDELYLKKEDGDVVVKVDQSTKDYIDDGNETIKVELNSVPYNVASSALETNFLGKKFYYYLLKKTN